MPAESGPGPDGPHGAAATSGGSPRRTSSTSDSPTGEVEPNGLGPEVERPGAGPPMANEYVALRAMHPTWLTMWLPEDVAALIQFDPDEVRELHEPARGIAFLSRGPGIVRVIASFRSQEILGAETRQNRYLAPARVTEAKGFGLPAAVVRHLGVRVTPRGPRGAQATDDALMWFLPAVEYYDYRSQKRTPGGWSGPRGGGSAHVYLTRSVFPLPSGLADIERRINDEEWRPRMGSYPRTQSSPA